MATHHFSFPDFQELRLPSLNLANVYSNQSLVAGAFFVQENSQLADLNEFPPRESMNHVNAPIFPSRFFFLAGGWNRPALTFAQTGSILTANMQRITCEGLTRRFFFRNSYCVLRAKIKIFAPFFLSRSKNVSFCYYMYFYSALTLLTHCMLTTTQHQWREDIWARVEERTEQQR